MTDGTGRRDPTIRQFFEAMDDDLNTPRALASLFDLARDINRNSDEGRAVTGAQDTLRHLGGILGLTFAERTADDGAANAGAGPFIDLLLETRSALRQARQFEQADRIRDGARAVGRVGGRHPQRPRLAVPRPLATRLQW